MTIIELIEKLETETHKRANEKKDTSFAFGIIKEWYVEMLALNPNRAYNKFDDYYHQIYGLIWGLRAAYYITNEERDQLMEDLQRISKEFYNINGAY